MKHVVIIGGGLAGLISAIQLANAGVPCLLIEKKQYPFHRVCGEYISNEVVPFLKRMELYPQVYNPSQINRFQLSAINGKSAILPLSMGGFGISRYTYDHYLFQKGENAGVEFLNEEARNIVFKDDKFYVETSSRTIKTDLVIGAYGKRSRLDTQLNRNFIKKRSPYVGVKYHAVTNHPSNMVALHNFAGGYCGVAAIENNKTNICYLTHRDNIKIYGDVKTMEENVLHKNPLLKEILKNADFEIKTPEVINEISFQTKGPIEDHILMCGDAAGMITPLCGNGMAMAIRSAKLVSELVVHFCQDKINRDTLEKTYAAAWMKNFKRRLWIGRQVQQLFGNSFTSSLATNLALHSKSVATMIIRNTHGKEF